MERDNRANRYSPETRARAVRMVLDNQGNYESQSTKIKAVAPKIGCGRDTLRRWVQQEGNRHRLPRNYRRGYPYRMTVGNMHIIIGFAGHNSAAKRVSARAIFP